MRQRELAATAKAFMLDRPEVSLQELTEHLRSMAEQFLTDASDDYWNEPPRVSWRVFYL